MKNRIFQTIKFPFSSPQNIFTATISPQGNIFSYSKQKLRRVFFFSVMNFMLKQFSCRWLWLWGRIALFFCCSLLYSKQKFLFLCIKNDLALTAKNITRNWVVKEVSRVRKHKKELCMKFLFSLVLRCVNILNKVHREREGELVWHDSQIVNEWLRQEL